MFIPQRLRQGLGFSFEFFSPKVERDIPALLDTVRELALLDPTFVSVTYGAGGSTRGLTLEVVRRIRQETPLEPMAHLAGLGHRREEIDIILASLRAAGVQNILCLRGDRPRDGSEVQGDFEYASDLAAHIRASGQWNFALGGACYPEVHQESSSPEADLQATLTKVRSGAAFLITQLFFDNQHYFRFVDRARAIGITVPIIPGIMPITNAAQIERFTKRCGATIPPGLRQSLDQSRDSPEAVAQLGIAYATAQCAELLAHGVPGIHFYTFNKSRATRQIVLALQSMR